VTKNFPRIVLDLTMEPPKNFCSALNTSGNNASRTAFAVGFPHPVVCDLEFLHSLFPRMTLSWALSFLAFLSARSLAGFRMSNPLARPNLQAPTTRLEALQDAIGRLEVTVGPHTLVMSSANHRVEGE